jgi:hypothetical protein
VVLILVLSRGVREGNLFIFMPRKNYFALNISEETSVPNLNPHPIDKSTEGDAASAAADGTCLRLKPRV